MGVERGTGGRVPRSQKISVGRPPRNDDISVYFFLGTYESIVFSNLLKKWSKSEEKLNFGGRWAWVLMNPSPKKTLWRRPERN